MTNKIGLLVLALGFLGFMESAACPIPQPPRNPAPPPLPPLADEGPRELPAVHAVQGVRTAGSQTYRRRVFNLRVTGYLSAAETDGNTAASRYSRTPVSFSLGIADWGEQIRLVVARTTDFRIILRADNPSSFDSFEFIAVEPGTYVFTLDSPGCRREPLDVDLRYRGRVLATRTVRPEVMEHPAMGLPDKKKEGPRRTPRFRTASG